MKQIEMKDIFDTQFENKEWYDERVRFYRYVIFASAGILTTLAFSWGKIPAKMLNSDELWVWLYRDSLILNGLTALLGLLTYYFTFRNRFFVPYAKKFADNYKAKKTLEKKFTTKRPKKHRGFFQKNRTREFIKTIYYLNARVRVPTDKFFYYLIWGITQISFLITLYISARLLLACFWTPTPFKEHIFKWFPFLPRL